MIRVSSPPHFGCCGRETRYMRHAPDCNQVSRRMVGATRTEHRSGVLQRVLEARGLGRNFDRQATSATETTPWLVVHGRRRRSSLLPRGGSLLPVAAPRQPLSPAPLPARQRARKAHVRRTTPVRVTVLGGVASLSFGAFMASLLLAPSPWAAVGLTASLVLWTVER